MSDGRRFRLQVEREDGAWQTASTFDTLDAALDWLEPGGRVVSSAIDQRPCRRGVVGVLVAFAFALGFSAAAVLMRRGAL